MRFAHATGQFAMDVCDGSNCLRVKSWASVYEIYVKWLALCVPILQTNLSALAISILFGLAASLPQMRTRPVLTYARHGNGHKMPQKKTAGRPAVLASSANYTR